MSLLPSEFVKDSIEVYLYRHTTKSRLIYWITLVIVIIALLSLPFIYVDISVQEPGVIRPVTEKTEIRSNVNEYIEKIYATEGQHLKKGDTLLTFRSSQPDNAIEYQQKRLVDYQEHLSDLRDLVAGMIPKSFHSETRKQEYHLFVKQKQEAETNVVKAEKDYLRNRALFEKSVIPEEEFEQYQYEKEKTAQALSSLITNRFSQWQTDLNAYTNAYEEMLSSLNQEITKKAHYTITSPIDGYLDHFRGIYPNSNIRTDALLAIISPDSILCVEAVVSPRNIGYVCIGMPVNIRVESFNYNEWGSLSGHVSEISSDFFTDTSSGTPYYKVKCILDTDRLIRKNGVEGILKKGMSTSVHFIITRRSLFDLLYQHIDDWINPTQYKHESVQ